MGRLFKIDSSESKPCDVCKVRRARWKFEDEKMGELRMCANCCEVFRMNASTPIGTTSFIEHEYEPIRVAC